MLPEFWEIKDILFTNTRSFNIEAEYPRSKISPYDSLRDHDDAVVGDDLVQVLV